MKTKKYPFIAPRSAQLLFDEAAIAEMCCRKYAEAAASAQAKAWELVKEVYPEDKDKIQSYNHVSHEVTIAPPGSTTPLRRKEQKASDGST